MKENKNLLKDDVGASSRSFFRIKSNTIKLGLPFIILGGIVLMGINSCTGFGGTVKGERLKIISSSPQYNEGQFQNPVLTSLYGEQGGILRFIKRYLTKTNDEREPTEQLPIKPITKEILSQKPKNGLRVFWLGHSSVLVEIDSYRVLTDPVFSDRVTPIQPM